jgi:DNA-binding transcriptional regulator GbsR (MarR family)
MDMIRKFLTSISPIVALCGAALLFSSCASRTETHDHHHAGAASNIKVPDRAAEIFAETDKHLQAFAAAIKSKDQRAVHQHDVAVRELIGRIPQRATSDIKAHVDEHVREISEAAKSAHAAAHDEEWAKADSEVKRAQESLKHLQSHFKERPY